MTTQADHNQVGEHHTDPMPNSVQVRAPDVVWDPTPDRGGLTFSNTNNAKLIVHTTETQSLPSYPYPPHVTINLLAPDTIWQHVTGTKGAYALKSSTPSPNYQMGAVWQVEHIAYARDTPNAPQLFYDSLAREVVWFHRNKGVPLVFAPVWEDGSAYGDWPGRMSAEEFTEFSGVCGHQHVYANDHWDPGALDILRLREAIDNWMEQTDPTEPSEEPEMILVEGTGGNGVESAQRALNNFSKLNNKGWKVAVDGTWEVGSAMTDRVKEFQKAINVEETGTLDGLTAAYLVGRYDPPKGL